MDTAHDTEKCDLTYDIDEEEVKRFLYSMK
jgi:hypothetical protein